MREMLAGMLIGALFMLMIFPETTGKNMRETYNSFMIGWESVR